MRKMTRQRLPSRGDTIVEVLIALAVVGIILGGAYATASRSLTNTRQAQERVEALKYAEEQVERLKKIALSVTSHNHFCIDNGNNPVNNNGSFITNPNTDNFDNYLAACRRPKGITYYITIERDDDSGVFTTHVRWDRAGGGGRDEVTLRYKPPS